MTVSHYFEITWWVLAVLALYSGVQAELFRGFIALTAFLLCAWTLLPISEHLSKLRPSLFLLLVGAVFILVEGGNRFRAEHDVILLVAHGLVAALPIFFLKRHHRLWSWLSFLDAAFIALTAVIAEGDFSEYMCFIWFLAFGAANLNAAHLYFLAGPSESSQEKLTHKYFFQFTGSVLSGFIFGATIFIGFPRNISWVNSWGIRQRQKNIGYTETISLDGTSLTNELKTLAFTIESDQIDFLAIFAKELYFRGRSVDTFDGKQWISRAKPMHPYLLGKDSRVVRSHANNIQRFKIYREPGATATLFYPGVLRTMEIPYGVSGGTVTDNDGNIFRTRTEAVPFTYEVSTSSPVLNRAAANLTLKEIAKSVENAPDRTETPFNPSAKELKYDTIIPKEVREAKYFQDWLKQLAGDKVKSWTVEQTLVTLRDYFKKNFEADYIHDFGKDHIFEQFLTKIHKGHCEYFATAAALFFRAHGVPARVVVGYHGGQFNEVSHVLEVYESNAHAWIEFFTPKYGWFAFDPTPPFGQQNAANYLALIDDYLSAARFWFHRYVVDYNSGTQISLFKQMTQKQSRDVASRWWKWKNIRLYLLGILLLAGGMILFRYQKQRFQKRSSLPKYYKIFLGRVRKQGWRRSPGESYQAFHKRLNKPFRNSRLIEEIDRALEKELYSGKSITPDYKTFLEKYARKTELTPINSARDEKTGTDG